MVCICMLANVYVFNFFFFLDFNVSKKLKKILSVMESVFKLKMCSMFKMQQCLMYGKLLAVAVFLKPQNVVACVMTEGFCCYAIV